MSRAWLTAAGLALVAVPAAAQRPPAPEVKPPAPEAPPPVPQGPLAVLRGLDKITARITTFEAPIDREVRFGTLRITVRTCAKRPPEEPPEVSAFLEIVEQRPGEREIVSLFTGWMFASSPALSALEHPVYDVWVIDCTIVSGESSSPRQ